ncbi:MAG: ThiF family adenylyltransferase [Rhodothalassiaceae bacterium]
MSQVSHAVPAEAQPAVRAFDYNEAFSRNWGWVTKDEQQLLRRKHAAIAGLGGVGGGHCITLARLGIGRFSIADLDDFDIANMNRQDGAAMSTMGRPKAQVIAERIRDINPEAEVRIFGQGVQPDTAEDFLHEVDLFVDGLDFFVMDVREQLHALARAKGIPAVIAGPFGPSTGYGTIIPSGMSFEDYFRLQGEPFHRKLIKFMVGLTPMGLNKDALVEPASLDFKNGKAPSLGLACDLARAVVGVEAYKLFLGRGKLRPLPWSQQFDPFKGQLLRSWMPGGNANPWRRFKIAQIEKRLTGGR